MDVADIYFNTALLLLKAEKDILIAKELFRDAVSIWTKNSEYEDSVKVTEKILSELSEIDSFSSNLKMHLN